MWRCQIIWVMLNSNHKFVDSESSQNHQMFSIRITDLVRAESELSCKNVLWFKPRDCRINCFPIKYNHMCSLFLTNCWIFQFPQYSSSRGTSQEILVWIELIKTNHSNVQPSDPAKNATSSHRIIFNVVIQLKSRKFVTWTTPRWAIDPNQAVTGPETGSLNT